LKEADLEKTNQKKTDLQTTNQKKNDKKQKDHNEKEKTHDKNGKEHDVKEKTHDKNGKEHDKNDKEPDKNDKEPDKNGKEHDKNGKERDKNGKEHDKNGKERDKNGKERDKNGKERDKNGKERDKKQKMARGQGLLQYHAGAKTNQNSGAFGTAPPVMSPFALMHAAKQAHLASKGLLPGHEHHNDGKHVDNSYSVVPDTRGTDSGDETSYDRVLQPDDEQHTYYESDVVSESNEHDSDNEMSSNHASHPIAGHHDGATHDHIDDPVNVSESSEHDSGHKMSSDHALQPNAGHHDGAMHVHGYDSDVVSETSEHDSGHEMSSDLASHPIAGHHNGATHVHGYDSDVVSESSEHDSGHEKSYGHVLKPDDAQHNGAMHVHIDDSDAVSESSEHEMSSDHEIQQVHVYTHDLLLPHHLPYATNASAAGAGETTSVATHVSSALLGHSSARMDATSFGLDLFSDLSRPSLSMTEHQQEMVVSTDTQKNLMSIFYIAAAHYIPRLIDAVVGSERALHVARRMANKWNNCIMAATRPSVPLDFEDNVAFFGAVADTSNNDARNREMLEHVHMRVSI